MCALYLPFILAKLVICLYWFRWGAAFSFPTFVLQLLKSCIFNVCFGEYWNTTAAYFQPVECQVLIDKLRSCSRKELLEALKVIDTWTYGKCELYHWIDILDMGDAILEEAATRVEPTSWTLACDLPQNAEVSANVHQAGFRIQVLIPPQLCTTFDPKIPGFQNVQIWTYKFC